MKMYNDSSSTEIYGLSNRFRSATGRSEDKLETRAMVADRPPPFSFVVAFVSHPATALEEVLVNDKEDTFAESAVLGELLLMAINNSKIQFPGQQILTQWLLRNLETFIQRHSQQFNRKVYAIYNLLIDRSDHGTILMNDEANRLLREYILANQTGFFQEWLIQPGVIGNFDAGVYRLDPLIPQYLGYKKFEELLYFQPQAPAITKLQSFFIKFKAEKFTQCSHDPKIIEIFSDERTEFDHSPTYPSFLPEKSAISINKLPVSDAYPVFKYSQWITRNGQLALEEAVNGGEYYFTKSFAHSTFEKQLKAKIHCLVDDGLSFIINNNRWEFQFGGWHELHTLEIGEFLVPGENEIIFIVENVSMDAVKIASRPENNPYEFIYYIQIFEESRK
jgi:hypothetical protein